MKYIVLKLKGDADSPARELPIIFPKELVHSEVAAALRRIRPLREAEPISAGEFSPIKAVAFGESTTLKLKSREIVDTRLIMMNDYEHGLVDEEQ